MLASLFGSIGGFFGNLFGGGILSSAGKYIGKWLGESLEEEEIYEQYHIGRVKNKLYPISHAKGQVIALVFGTAKVNGYMIWSDPIREVPRTESARRFVQHAEIISYNTEFLYFCNFAIALCEGEVSSIDRVWCNDELIDIGNYKHRIYKGTESQEPDHVIMRSLGEGNVPAFRGICYIVFEEFPLVDFRNNIPKFSFEVTRKSNTRTTLRLENKISAVNIIPASGEFVYDTQIQTKKILQDGIVIREEKINSHNRDNIANALYSLKYLKELCPNTKYLSIVVSWFGNDLDIGLCDIYPAVEFPPSPGALFSEEWKVATYNRATAMVISKDEYGSPNYGGTVSDASLIRYITELKAQGYKIALYPMIFMDVPQKPWRGHLTGDAANIHAFFNKERGYNNFILHYARLFNNLVDLFIIGSEFVKLTSIRDKNIFPAVNELCDLAARVRAVLPPATKITYAADWSEYHHTDGGWYHLDTLWASPHIDFVAIDNYMPLTNTEFASPSKEEIIKGFDSGEGYEYYLEGDVQKKLDPPYAWKNIEWWWSNTHTNPDGRRTEWIPKSKKIIFTEYGFPSIDKATNQPNVFYNPKCRDGGLPKFSNALIDNRIQRMAIEAFIDFWSKKEFIEEMFLWCFDARPYPSWPHSNIWADGQLWPMGHWINGKLGGVLLSEVIEEICLKSGLEPKITISGYDERIFDICLTKKSSGLELLNLLRSCYFFDIADSLEESLYVKQFSHGNLCQIDLDHLLGSEYPYSETEIAETSKLSKLNVRYYSFDDEYGTSYASANRDGIAGVEKDLRLPFVMSSGESHHMIRNILLHSKSQKQILSFLLPMKYLGLNIGDMIIISSSRKKYHLRIIHIVIQESTIEVLVAREAKYDLTISNNVKFVRNEANTDIGITQLDAYNLEKIFDHKVILFANYSNRVKPLLISADDQYFEKITDIKGENYQGIIVATSLCPINFAIINGGYIDILAEQYPKDTARSLWQISSAIIINDQIIFIGKITKIGHNIARLSELVFPVSDKKYEINRGDKLAFLTNIYSLNLHAWSYVQLFYKSGKKSEAIMV